MKKHIIFINCFLLLSAVCWAGGGTDQPSSDANFTGAYFTGDGGAGTSLAILAPKATGLAANQNYIPALVQGELVNNFITYTAISVLDRERLDDLYDELVYSATYDETAEAGMDLGHLPPTDYIMQGSITRTAIGYNLQIFVTKTAAADKMTVASFSETCTAEELDDLTGVRRASLSLLQKMGVVATELAKSELSRAAASNEVTAQTSLAKSITAATEFEKTYYIYQANQLDPELAEAARRVAAYQTEIYQTPKINFAMPEIRIPEIKAPEFKAPEIKMAATGNIGADARRQVEQYNAQKEVSRLRQESGDRAVKDLQNAFLDQFRVQSESVKKQQADLLRQRDILLEQQKTLLERQQQMIAQLRETENSYDALFTEHPPFEIIYDPAVKPVGDADLVKETIDMEFAVTTVGTQAMQVISLMLADFEKGLETITQGLKDINAEFDKIQSLIIQVEATGQDALKQLVNDYAAQVAKVEAAENSYAVQLANLDVELKTSGYAKLGQDYAVRVDAGYAENLAGQYAVKPSGYSAGSDKTLGAAWSLTKWNKDGSWTFGIAAELENDAGKIISTADIQLTNQIYATVYTKPLSASSSCVFRGVPVNDITDTLKVSIRQVNGRDVTVAANAGYIKISPLEADGYTKDGWDIYGYNKKGYDVYGYGKNGYDKDGYYKDGYDKNGFDRSGRNRSGFTKEQVAQQDREQRYRHIDQLWRPIYIGFFVDGQFNINPTGGLFELGLDAGGKWLVLDFGLGWGGGGSFKVTDEIVEEKAGSIDWSGPHIFGLRVGAAIPVNFERARLNIGGGIEWLNITVWEHLGKTTDSEEKNTSNRLDTIIAPYLGARFDVALTRKGGLLWFVGYRCEFMPADQLGTYFGDSSSLRHTIFSGFTARALLF